MEGGLVPRLGSGHEQDLDVGLGYMRGRLVVYPGWWCLGLVVLRRRWVLRQRVWLKLLLTGVLQLGVAIMHT